MGRQNNLPKHILFRINIIGVMVESVLEQQLIEIQRRINDIEQPPATTLEIIGRANREDVWEAFLVYFLDDDNPHGFGTDILEAFLRAIVDHSGTKLSGPLHGLDRVEIESQVPTGSGLVDVLLWVESEWYICIELKVGSPETGEQTVRYADATALGELVVSQHDGVGDYIYLAPENAQSPTADDFVELSWETVVNYLEDVLVQGCGQYPMKSTAQLADYVDTIRQELNMNDLNGVSDETVLYVEYADTIKRIIEQYEADRDKLFNALRDAFFSESDCTRDEWEVSNRTDRYIKFYKPEWQRMEGGVSIEYEPHLHLDQDRPEIRLRLDIEHGDKKAVRDEFSDKLDRRGQEELERMGWEVTNGSFGYMVKSVPLDLDDTQESIRKAIRELHEFREIVEPSIEEVVADR